MSDVQLVPTSVDLLNVRSCLILAHWSVPWYEKMTSSVKPEVQGIDRRIDPRPQALENSLQSRIENRDQTDRILILFLTLTCDLQFQSSASHGSDPYTQKIKAKHVGSKDNVEIGGWTDRRTEAIALPAVLTRSVNMHKNFGEVRPCGSRVIRADRQTVLGE